MGTELKAITVALPNSGESQLLVEAAAAVAQARPEALVEEARTPPTAAPELLVKEITVDAEHGEMPKLTGPVAVAVAPVAPVEIQLVQRQSIPRLEVV